MFCKEEKGLSTSTLTNNIVRGQPYVLEYNCWIYSVSLAFRGKKDILGCCKFRMWVREFYFKTEFIASVFVSF